MKREDPAVSAPEDQGEAQSQTKTADEPKLEHRVCRAQGGFDHRHPRLGELLPAGGDAQFSRKYRRMAAQQDTHVYMEKLEESADALQEPAQVRIRTLAGTVRVVRTQRLLAHSWQLDNDEGGNQRQTAQSGLSDATWLLCETASKLVNRRMPNGTYGGVRGRETKVGQKTFVSRPTRLGIGQ